MHQHAGTHDREHASHGHGNDPATAGLRLAFFVNLLFTIVETIGGWWTNSISVLTDAVHDLGDALVLGIAWYLQHIAAKGRDARYSYGYGRYSMLGGWVTSVVLIIGGILMIVASVLRLANPVLPHTSGMLLIAVFGLAMNGFAAWKLHGGSSLNERGAYLHLLEDVLGWTSVLIGAALMHFTGWAIVDPLLAIGISIFILWNAIGTLRKGTRILMQAQPTGIDAEAIKQRLLTLPSVVDIHDQHSWTLDGTYVVHTVHLVIGDHGPTDAKAIKIRARAVLTEMGVHHATIELEWPGEQCTLEAH